MKCNASGNDHDDPKMTHYTSNAQEIFEDHYNHIIEVTGL